MYNDPCHAPGCLDLVGKKGARGYCSKHHHRFMRYGDPLSGGVYKIQQQPTCQVESCLEPTKSLNYCQSHYDRFHRYGDPLEGGPPQTTKRVTHADQIKAVEQYLGYFPLPETFSIPMAQGLVTVIDANDWKTVNAYSWQPCRIRGGALVYAVTQYDGSTLSLHRLLMEAPDEFEVDHRDGDGLNNRRSNLRLATPSQNRANSKRRYDNTSGYKGVSWSKQHNKWQTHIGVNGKSYYLGLFIDPWEAACAYNDAALNNFGEFARLNVKLD